MGKPFASELQHLADTYAWSINQPIEPLVNAITLSASLPLITIGSGGSLTAAHFASGLHQRNTRKVAKAVTPLEGITSIAGLKDVAIFLLSAGGKNSDIIGAFKRVVLQEPQRLLVVCARTKSPLSRLAHAYRYVDIFDFDLPSGRDGFLATNSLLAFSILLTRAYEEAFLVKSHLPPDLDALVHPGLTQIEFTTDLRDKCNTLWQRENLAVLYGPSAHSAALDLESKFTEAALGPIQIADYRNFAHGRHHWLAKRGQTTAVLALVTEEDRDLAAKTLRLIPSDIPSIKIDLPNSGVRAGLAALVFILHITRLAGEARGIDPGRPGVPRFGSKIYNIRALSTFSPKGLSLTSFEAVAIERKAEKSIDVLADNGELEFWIRAYGNYIERLQTASYGAVVFDYDGTLCDRHDRYNGIDSEVTCHLLRILKAGIPVGIATGRGKSIKDVLRSRIPLSLWSQVLVGYYNGSDNGLLSDDSFPHGGDYPCSELLLVREAINSDAALSHLSEYIKEIAFRHTQITIEMKTFAPVAIIWNVIQQTVQKLGIPGVTVLCSTHSIDILAPGVSKRAIVNQISHMVFKNEAGPILCIGDRGQWPGNDFALLTVPYSLSVDEVSSDPETCWNLAPPGYRGVQATLDYFNSLYIEERSLKLSMHNNSHGQGL